MRINYYDRATKKYNKTKQTKRTIKRVLTQAWTAFQVVGFVVVVWASLYIIAIAAGN